VRVAVVGGGAREHALVRALHADPMVDAVACGPGNAGTDAEADPLPLDPTSPDSVVAAVRAWDADLVVIGPEAPLVAGVGDALRDAGLTCFGPSAASAQLEASKSFAKTVMAAASVPTAMARLADTPAEAADALDAFGPPYVVKADGLAGGKGVVVTDDRSEALAHAAAAGRVVIEEYLDGPEVSLFCLCDGVDALALPAAQDFKRLGDGDTGPNTGGMGAYSPLPWAPPDLAGTVVDRVALPVLAEMAARGTPFVGLLYVGLALGAAGPRVVEFNARFGDPETVVVLPRVANGIGSLLTACARGDLASAGPIRERGAAVVAVVLAAAGYPGQVRTGDEVTGLDAAAALPGVGVLHAGTRRDTAGRVRSTGGRVLAVSGTGADLAGARDAAYAGVAKLGLAGGQFRHDIAGAAVGSGRAR